MRIYFAFLLALLTANALAGPRGSASYSIITETADGGGGRATSAAYTSDGSSDRIAVSTAASSVCTTRGGYAGQLYEIKGLVLNSGSVSSSMNESGTLQLAAWQLLDDSSYLVVSANSVAWTVMSGPVANISESGLATAGVVYQNTTATVRGVFGGMTGQLDITILDSMIDNFGSYAGDGIDDGWQVQYFGINNPLAGPNVDADGTGQTNFFKFIAGLDPTDPADRFALTIVSVTGRPEQKQLTFGPIAAGRTYTIVAKTALADPVWSAISSSAAVDNGVVRTVIDLNSSGSGATKFYRVEITKP